MARVSILCRRLLMESVGARRKELSMVVLECDCEAESGRIIHLLNKGECLQCTEISVTSFLKESYNTLFVYFPLSLTQTNDSSFSLQKR